MLITKNKPKGKKGRKTLLAKSKYTHENNAVWHLVLSNVFIIPSLKEKYLHVPVNGAEQLQYTLTYTCSFRLKQNSWILLSNKHTRTHLVT